VKNSAIDDVLPPSWGALPILQVNMVHFLLKEIEKECDGIESNEPKKQKKMRKQQQQEGQARVMSAQPSADEGVREIISLASLAGRYLGCTLDKRCQFANEARVAE
jgi:hypothetical protein